MSATIYVGLLGEGTNLWRPVSAEQVRDDVFRILGTQPTGETWQFTPGNLVRCRQHIFAGGEAGLIAYEKAAA
jgi:hypothetical protein